MPSRLIEQRVKSPFLPLNLFRSRQFTGANLTTLAVYTAVGGALFLLVLQLQQSLHYSALRGGLATLPMTIIILIGSPWIGAFAQRTGPRLPDDRRTAHRRNRRGVDGPASCRGLPLWVRSCPPWSCSASGWRSPWRR